MKQVNESTLVITISSQKASRQAVQFFKENKADYIEKNVIKEPLSEADIQYLFYRAGGMDKVLATKSKSSKELQNLLENEDVKMSDVYQFIQKNPKALKFPIILDKERLMVGYNELNIRAFLPRDLKMKYFYRTLEQEKRKIAVNL
ncbi:ArsC/Spx/MgsR family protein [Virgibacillus halodenitrificans]|uniref:ArsC/Spx/MgsR family protein n=1 Tax=Virgibacillus halodenitrificans TaxID=1482 RepID=UPI0013CE7D9A|nr:ArsC/Spx/MgsR family protein [Virgibacillus halodenitrificans]